MAKSYEELKNEISAITNEVEDGANTANRIGGAMADIADFAKESLEAQEERINEETDIKIGGLVVQETGDGEGVVMSQKAVTEKIGELASKTENIYTQENASRYSKITIPFYLKKGAAIINNGVNLIVSDDDSVTDGRQDIITGATIILNSDKGHIQVGSVAGNVDFIYRLSPSIEEFFEEKERTELVPNVFRYTTTKAYETIVNFPALKKGVTIVNNGEITVMVANDSAFNGRIDIHKGECVVLDSDKSWMQGLSEIGEVVLGFQTIFAKTITEREIVDNSISEKSLSFMIRGNLINPDEIRLGKYYNAGSGMYYANESYNATGKIKVKPGVSYVANETARFIDFRNDSTQQYISNEYVKAGASVVAPEWAEFMVVSFSASYEINKCNIIEGTTWRYLGEYEDIIISPSLLPSYQENVSLKDISVKGTLNLGDNLLAPLVNVTKNIAMSAIVCGTLSDVRMGVALNGYYGKNIRITQTQITEYSGSNDSQGKSVEHGLTLTGMTFVSMYKNNDDKMTIRITTDKGTSFETEISWGTTVGQPFFRNNGNSALEVSFTFQPRDIDKDIWMFGDSYFGMYDTSRWPYYILTWGFTNFLLDARGGETAPEALSDLQNLLATGHRPKYIVWCHGMNGGRDNGTEVNATWLSATSQMLNLCKQCDITPILATIPSVPSEIHVNLNAWVKASGYRYIDFASAVETDGSLYWKGWETSDALLSGDEVHPSAKGALVLASQVLNDFAEITTM